MLVNGILNYGSGRRSYIRNLIAPFISNLVDVSSFLPLNCLFIILSMTIYKCVLVRKLMILFFVVVRREVLICPSSAINVIFEIKRLCKSSVITCDDLTCFLCLIFSFDILHDLSLSI